MDKRTAKHKPDDSHELSDVANESNRQRFIAEVKRASADPALRHALKKDAVGLVERTIGRKLSSQEAAQVLAIVRAEGI